MTQKTFKTLQAEAQIEIQSLKENVTNTKVHQPILSSSVLRFTQNTFQTLQAGTQAEIQSLKEALIEAKVHDQQPIFELAYTQLYIGKVKYIPGWYSDKNPSID
jgi:hypothetical protein